MICERLGRRLRWRLRERAISGEFEASAEESDAWFNGEEGQAVLAALVRKTG